MKKLQLKPYNEFCLADNLAFAMDKSYIKINEIVDWINLQEKRPDFFDDFINPTDNFNDVWGEDTQNVFCYTDKENEVIKKCLKYCWHRYYQHTHAGIHSALSQEDRKIFVKIIEKL